MEVHDNIKDQRQTSDYFRFYKRVHFTSLRHRGWVTPVVALLRLVGVGSCLYYTLFYQIGSQHGYLKGVTPSVQVNGLLQWPSEGTLDSINVTHIDYCRGIDWQGLP